MEEIKSKVCPACNEQKELTPENFRRDARSATGFMTKCKECVKNRIMIPKTIPKEGFKICAKCEEEKPATLEYFGKSTGRRDGLYNRCITCVSKQKYKPVENKNNLKECIDCKESFPQTLEYFGKANKAKDGLNARCKECYRKIKREAYRKPENIAKTKTPEYREKVRKSRDNPEFKAKMKVYRQDPEVKKRRLELERTPEYKAKKLAYQERPDVKKKLQDKRNTPEYKDYQRKKFEEYKKRPEYKIKQKEQYEKHKHKKFARAKERRRLEPKYKLKNNLSRNIRSQLTKINGKKSSTTLSYVGVSQKELTEHLDNGIYGLKDYAKNRKGDIKFHIDHIIPSAYFLKKIEIDKEGNVTAETEYWMYKWWNYRNLRIWPAFENGSKGDKIDMELIKEHGIEDLL